MLFDLAVSYIHCGAGQLELFLLCLKSLKAIDPGWNDFPLWQGPLPSRWWPCYVEPPCQVHFMFKDDCQSFGHCNFISVHGKKIQRRGTHWLLTSTQVPGARTHSTGILLTVRETKKGSLYSGKPCVQLRLKISLFEEEGKDGQLR